MSDPFQGQEFITASARGDKDPIRLRISGRRLSADGDSLEDVEQTMIVDPATSIVSFGKMFGAFIGLIRHANGIEADVRKLQDAIKSGDLNELDPAILERQVEALDKIGEAVGPTRKALRTIIVPPHRERYDEVADMLDVESITNILVYLTGRLSPRDFSEPESSSDGSGTTGDPSAAGAPSTASMPPPSPSIAP